jgi:hypothetical protein
MLNAGLLLLVASLQTRAPIPDAGAQKEAEKLIHDLFKEDYAKKAPTDRFSLAEKMLKQARETKNELSACFVLYRESQDLFAQSGEVVRAFDAIDEMYSVFAIDPLGLKAAALATAAKASKSPEDASRIAAAQLRLAADAVAADQFDAAEKAVQAAIAGAKKGANTGLAFKSTAKSKEIGDLKARFDKVKKSRETLSSKPDDGPANFSVGYYQAVVKGLWAAGLPYLVKASEESYRSAAAKDLASPADPTAQLAVGDSWWDLAEKESASARENLRARAQYWYEKAEAKLAGLSKVRVEKRVQELRLEKLNRGTWVDISDPKLFGKAQPPLEVGAARTTLKTMPPGTYDGLTVHVKLKGDGEFGVDYDPDHHNMGINTVDGYFKSCHVEGNTWKHDAYWKLSKKEEYLMTLLIVDGEGVFFLDGIERFRIKAPIDHIIGVQFYAWIGPVQFDQIKLRKRE